MQPRCFFFSSIYKCSSAAVSNLCGVWLLKLELCEPTQRILWWVWLNSQISSMHCANLCIKDWMVLSAVMRRKVLNKCKCPAYSYVEGTTTEMQPLCLWLVERAKPKLVFCFLAFSQAITWLNGEEEHRWVCFLPLFPGFFVIAGLHACYDHHLKLSYLVLFFFLIHFCLEEARIKAVPKLCCHSSLIWKNFKLIHTFLWLLLLLSSGYF